MTVTLKAPIDEAEYRTMMLLPMPSDFSGDKAINLLNQAWGACTKWAEQPLSETENTDTYRFPSRYANVQPEGYTHVITRYTPIISVASVKWTTSAVSVGWTTSSLYDTLDDEVIVYDSPFRRGQVGLLQVVYSSGYETVPDDLKWACAAMAAMFLSCGFFPTQGSTAIMPEFLDGANVQSYYRLRQILDKYKRRR